MELLSKPNFLLTLSELFSNLSAGWFGAVLILPGIWSSYDLQSNIVLFMFNIFYGFTCLLISYYLKELSYADWYSKNNTCCPKPFGIFLVGFLTCLLIYLRKRGVKWKKWLLLMWLQVLLFLLFWFQLLLHFFCFCFKKILQRLRKLKSKWVFWVSKVPSTKGI